MRFTKILITLALFLPGIISADALKMSTSTVKPWGYLNSEGTPSGLLTNFAKLLMRQGNLSVQNTLKPYPRVIVDMQNGQSDIAVLFKSPEADRVAFDLGKIVDTSIIVTGLAGTQPVKNIDQLVGARIGYIRGSRYGAAFDDHPHLNKVPINDMEQGISMLLMGRIEAIASSDYSLYYTIRTLDIDPLRLSHLMTLRTTSGHLYLSRQSSHLDMRTDIENALVEIENSGALQRLFSKPYLSDRLPAPFTDDSSYFPLKTQPIIASSP